MYKRQLIDNVNVIIRVAALRVGELIVEVVRHMAGALAAKRLMEKDVGTG